MGLGGIGKTIGGALSPTIQQAMRGLPDLSGIVGGLAQALGGASSIIQTEMQAFQNDKNPAHLLRVIEIQGALLQQHGVVMDGMTQQSAGLGGVLNHLMQTMQGNTAGPLPAIAGSINSASSASVAGMLAGSSSASDSAKAQELMQAQQRTFQLMSDMLKRLHDSQQSIIQNMK